MVAYYNEIDPFAADWLRELIKAGHIAPGEVDTRDIQDVTAHDIRGFTQCHFFAGIGVWSLALRLAGWSDERPIWTGSCPCQPFSAAGKRKGFADERHLWPAFFHLIEIARPERVLGEQVASKDSLAWLDLVAADMEGAGYAFGAVDICAAGVGAPHIRQRLFWVADADSKRQEKCDQGKTALGASAERDRATSGLAFSNEGKRGRFASGEGCERDGETPGRLEGYGESQSFGFVGAALPGPTNGLWRDADWIFCRDGKWRPVEPGTFPLVDARTLRYRVAELRGSGNAINVAQAKAFIEAAFAL